LEREVKKLLIIAASAALLLTGCNAPSSFDGYVHAECEAATQAPEGKVTVCSATEKPLPTATATATVTETVPGPTTTVTVTATPSPSPTATQTTPPASNERVITNAYVTGYTYYDNTPPGTAQIAYEDVRPATTGAGGSGTFANPITIAVGHVKNAQGVSTPDYPKGTVFYVPNVRRYFIVEDLCGDGATPQNIPCHNLDAPGNDAPAGATTWVDIWLDGRTGTATAADNCANKITKLQTIVQNPASNYAVVTGPVANGSCTTYGNALITQ
jgi:hypothetical protein